MRHLFYSPSAAADLREIRLFVAMDRPETADRLILKIDQHLQRLRFAPESGRERPDLGAGIRMIVVARYVVLYRIDGDAVRIVRVAHGARDFPDAFGSEFEAD